MDITILGTSASIPTKERNVSGLFIHYKTDGILFDCGEATQRQLNIAGISRQAVTKIFITHWHGDHMGGLIGLLQTMSQGEENKSVDIYGPRYTKQRMQHLLGASEFNDKLAINVHEVIPKGIEIIFENEDYAVSAAPLVHSTPCIGLSFATKDKRSINMPLLRRMGVPEGPHLKKLQEGKDITYNGKLVEVDAATTIKKGKKFVYVTDTYLCENAVKLAKNADVLVCEATYANALEEKAEQYKHLTGGMAAAIATQAGVKKLILTHFSQRYKDVREIEQDATAVFPNTVCAKDFMKVKM